MIRVVKPTEPTILRTHGIPATQAHCVAYGNSPTDYHSSARKFEFDKTIYAAAEVKDALLQAQNQKCAFCESFVRHISYGDVEHFRPKAGYKQREVDSLKRPGYYWLAYTWENLFFCCQLCNEQFKRNLFPLRNDRSRARSHTDDLRAEEPLLVDPARHDPSAFIRFRKERAVAVRGCREGRTTIRVLGLNRPELMEVRAKWLQTLRQLRLARDLLRQKIATSPKQTLSTQLSELEATLQKSQQETGEYSAMARAFLAP
jgi:uncharacterized protein (TIGR02646 family)